MILAFCWSLISAVRRWPSHFIRVILLLLIFSSATPDNFDVVLQVTAHVLIELDGFLGVQPLVLVLEVLQDFDHQVSDLGASGLFLCLLCHQSNLPPTVHEATSVLRHTLCHWSPNFKVRCSLVTRLFQPFRW